MLKEQLESAGTPEPLSDDDLHIDPDLYQELCSGAFDDQNLVSPGGGDGGVSSSLIPWSG